MANYSYLHSNACAVCSLLLSIKSKMSLRVFEFCSVSEFASEMYMNWIAFFDFALAPEIWRIDHLKTQVTGITAH